MNNLIHKVLRKIAQESYNTTTKSVNTTSGKGIYQPQQPKVLEKLKNKH